VVQAVIYIGLLICTHLDTDFNHIACGLTPKISENNTP
jgi:hypothetical protein